MTTGLRLRIALDHSPCDPRTLAWTVQLARRLEAQLDARFIEDRDLYTLAELPFQGRPGDGLTPQGLDQAMQRQARRLESQLRELTEREALELSFNRVRGALLEEVRRAQEGVGLLVLQGFQPARPKLASVTQRPAGSTVMVLFDGSEAAQRTLALALEGTPADSLLVLLQADNREQARQELEDLGTLTQGLGARDLRRGFLPRHDGEHLLHLVGLEHPAAVFVAQNNVLLEDHPLRELISALPCPLVITG